MNTEERQTGNNRKETPYDGKKAMIVGNHPHVDAIVICQGSEYTALGWGLVFKRLDDDKEFFVFKPVNVKWL